MADLLDSRAPTIVGRHSTTAHVSSSGRQARAAPGHARHADSQNAAVRPRARPRDRDPYRQTTNDALVVEHGSLYPALHRLQRDGFISSKWDKAPDKNRELKYYRLTAAGRRQPEQQQSKWDELVRAIGSVMDPLPEG